MTLLTEAPPRWTIFHRPVALPDDPHYTGPFCARCGDYTVRHAPWWRRVLRQIGKRVLP